MQHLIHNPTKQTLVHTLGGNVKDSTLKGHSEAQNHLCPHSSRPFGTHRTSIDEESTHTRLGQNLTAILKMKIFSKCSAVDFYDFILIQMCPPTTACT